jgi:hypothetical protein
MYESPLRKYVYLHYLRDRAILSKARLAEWQLDESAIFGPNATSLPPVQHA